MIHSHHCRVPMYSGPKRALINRDLHHHSGHASPAALAKNNLCNRGFRFSVWLRLAASSDKWGKLTYPFYTWEKQHHGFTPTPTPA